MCTPGLRPFSCTGETVLQRPGGRRKSNDDVSAALCDMRCYTASAGQFVLPRNRGRFVFGDALTGHPHPLLQKFHRPYTQYAYESSRSWWEGSERHIQLSVVEHHPSLKRPVSVSPLLSSAA